jgi:hypothetical protein
LIYSEQLILDHNKLPSSNPFEAKTNIGGFDVWNPTTFKVVDSPGRAVACDDVKWSAQVSILSKVDNKYVVQATIKYGFIIHPDGKAESMAPTITWNLSDYHNVAIETIINNQ